MTTYLLGVVAVLRKCRQCGEWKSIGSFGLNGSAQPRHTCKQCYRPGPHIGNGGGSRTITVTPDGREYLASLKQGAA